MSNNTEVPARSDQLVWIDLEMTGLNPEKHQVLEIASLVTDGNLKLVAEGPNLVIHHSKAILESMDPWSEKQHAKSGLTARVKESLTGLEEAEQATLNFMKQYCKANVAPLCGNTVHHDRRFLVKYMPSIHEFLHYRHVDVSTVKDIVARWYPNEKAFGKKKDSHRALQDIRESVEELRFYRERFFKAAKDVVKN
jgi:oligoribonuclease